MLGVRKKKFVWGYGALAWSLSELTLANCITLSSYQNTNGNNGTYAQNGVITCTGDTATSRITGAINGYGRRTLFSGHFISQQTSQVLRWTNPVAGSSGNLEINVEPGATVTGENLSKGLLLIHAGFYTPNGSGVNPVAPQITPEKHFAMVINNQGSVLYSNPSNTPNDNTYLAAGVAIEGNDSPVDQLITNTGRIYSESAWGVLMSGIAIRPLATFVPLSEYKYSYGNVINLLNSGEIIQTKGDISSSSTYYGHSAAVGLMMPSAKEVLLTNTQTGLISGKRIGVDVLTDDVVLASSIDNAGRIDGGEEGVALSPGTLSATIRLRPTLSSLVNRSTGVIYGGLRGVSNDGTIETIDNAGRIEGGEVGLSLLLADTLNPPVLSTLLNRSTGVIEGVQQGVVNEGSIGRIDNYGTIIGSDAINSTAGEMLDAINNYGALNGNVRLGAATLNLQASPQSVLSNPQVSGDITGAAGSRIQIGAAGATRFETRGNADVDQLTVHAGSQLVLGNAALWSALASGIDNSGLITLTPQATEARLAGTLRNSGRIAIDCSTCSKQRLYVAGDYQGNAGALALAVTLGADNSDSEKLIIDGNASGVTRVSVSNKGGKGAVTQRGIKVIQTTSSDAGAFVQAGRAVAGVYDYTLRKGDSFGADLQSWYLTSHANNPEPDPDEPEIYRPEVGSYLANLEVANSMFNMQLHDRLGEVRYLNADEQGAGTVWLRAVAANGRFYENYENIKTTGHRSLMQIGADLWQGAYFGNDSLRFGLMGAYAIADNKTRSSLSGYGSKGKVDGYSLGVYGTWFEHQDEKTGAYLDSWAQYKWLKAEVNGDELDKENYKLKGLVASIEAGYSLMLAQTERADYRIQPSAQMTWSDVHFGDVLESNGTLIKASGHVNLQSRLGVRAYLDSKLWDTDDKALQTFVEVNWLHNSRGYSLHVEDVHLQQAGYKDLKEVKAGIEGKFAKNTSAWASFGHKWGKEDFHDAQGMLGITHQF